MRSLARKGIALEFTIGLVLTVAMLIIALVIFSDIFSYESEAKGHESFVRLVAMMHNVNREPEGTRESVLVRLPDDWAILGFDGTPLEAVRMLSNGMVVQRRAYIPDTPECGAGRRCICLVKNLDVAQTIYWERTMRCVNLGEEGEDIPLPHYTNVGTEEYVFGGETLGRILTYSFVWKGGFAIIEDEDDWSEIWDSIPGVDILEEQAASVAAPVFVEKISRGRIAVCTNEDTCIPQRSDELHRRRESAIERYQELERRWEGLLSRRAQEFTEQETEALHTDFHALMQEYDTFLASRDYVHLTQYQQDTIYAHRLLAAQYSEAWDLTIQYIDEALQVVQDENLRQTAQTAKDMFYCEARETLDYCRDLPPVCAWIQGECVRLQSIRPPDANCSLRENEGDCLFEHPRLCRWVEAAIGARCESVP